jgi:DNA polymerase-3 subunit alpha
MGAIKGVGSGAVATIVNSRKMEIQIDFDLAKRIDFALPIKKAIENLALAGGFDSLRDDKRQYFHDDGDGITFYEKLFGMELKSRE